MTRKRTKYISLCKKKRRDKRRTASSKSRKKKWPRVFLLWRATVGNPGLVHSNYGENTSYYSPVRYPNIRRYLNNAVNQKTFTTSILE